MRNRLLLLLLASLTLATAAGAATPEPWFEEQCARGLPPNKITIISEPSQLQYRFDRSYKELTHKHSGNANSRTMGLTEARFQTTASGKTTALVSGAMTCARLDITVVATASPQVVSVARELPQGSCGYEFVLKHEFKHVHANQNHLESMVDRLQRELGPLLGDNILYGSQAEVKEQMQRFLDKELVPYVSAKVVESRALHEAIDREDSPDRVSRACGGEISAATR